MTVPKISDHHHLLQAPANQLSVLPKKKCRSAISQKKSLYSQFFSIRAERESSAAGRVFSCPRFEIIFLLNGAARRGSPSDQNYERRE